MVDGVQDDRLASQLLVLAADPALRQSVYERLGEYCHHCRNRLNSLKLSLYLAMKQSSEARPEAWAAIDEDYQELERVVERVQTLCRPMSLTRVTIGLDLLIDDRREQWSQAMARCQSDLEVIPPRSRALASFDVERMGQALDALVAWRAGEPESDREAMLRWWVDGGEAHVSWDEVGPTSKARRARARPRPSSEGAVWTLPLLARVLQAHGGHYRLASPPGWGIDLAWPVDPPSI